MIALNRSPEENEQQVTMEDGTANCRAAKLHGHSHQSQHHLEGLINVCMYAKFEVEFLILRQMLTDIQTNKSFPIQHSSPIAEHTDNTQSITVICIGHFSKMVDARPNYAHIGEMVDF